VKLTDNTVLIVIDVQKAFDHPRWGDRNNPDAESKVARLLTAWRAKKLPVIHVHHRNPRAGSLFNPGSPGVEVKPEAAPFSGEPVLYKDVNSAFIGTDLQERLQAAGAKSLVLAGMTTDHCVSTTTRMAGNLGFETYLVSDATATFGRKEPDGRYFSAEQMHDTALASLRDEFATVVSTGEILKALEAVPQAQSKTAPGDEVEDKFRQYTERMLSFVDGDALEMQASAQDKLARLIKDVPLQKLTTRPAAEKWSVGEILAHLADTEVVGGFRLRKIVGEPGSSIPAYDQDAWAKNLNYASRDPHQSLKDFAVARERNVALLRNLTEEQWERYGIHAERGKESVRHMVRLYAGHDVNHRKQVEAILNKR
jgi:nicotinamidase-related amidase/uncharacterized damage-inducible protein DinB